MGDADDSGTALTIRQLLLELRKDMQFVRPAVTSLVDANVIERVGKLEAQRIGISAVVHALGAARAFLLLAFAAIGAVSTVVVWLHA